jgi:hypothetical protein
VLRRGAGAQRIDGRQRLAAYHSIGGRFTPSGACLGDDDADETCVRFSPPQLNRVIWILVALVLPVSISSAASGQAPGRKAPSNTSPPTISGTAQLGQTLSADPGSWSGPGITFSYQWQRCVSGTCATVAGATVQTYVPASSDVGATMVVVVKASNKNGETSADSAPSGAVAAAPVPEPGVVPPSPATSPTVTGTPKQGQTLTAGPGSWNGTLPLVYAYQWQRCGSSGTGCADVAGASGQTYALASADVGATMRVAVTASNSAGSATAASAPTAVVTSSATTSWGITPATLPSATVGSTYSQQLATNATNPPYSFRVVLGSLAPGTALSSAGAIAGTPTSAGSFGFTVAAQDSTGATVASQGYTLLTTTAPAPGVPASYFTGPLGTNNLIPAKTGAFLIDQYGGQGTTWDTEKADLLKRETDMGRKLDAIQFHYDGSGTWNGVFGMNDPTGYSSLPEPFLLAHSTSNFTVIAWTPNYTIGQMNNGAADAIWTKAANYWKTYAPGRIMLRAFPEFNLNTTYGAVPSSLNGNVNYCGAPFIAAWHRMVSVFQANGATNVGFMYNMDEGNNRGCVNSSYPGNAYVDWVGSDTYNRCRTGDGNCYSTPLHSGWAEWWELFNYSKNGGLSTGTNTCSGGTGNCRTWTMYDIFASGTATRSTLVQTNGLPADLPAQKPFVVGETETIYDANNPASTPKGDWFRHIPAAVNSMPYLRGISFYDADVSSLEGSMSNFRIDYATTNPDVYAGFKTLAADPSFNTR